MKVLESIKTSSQSAKAKFLKDVSATWQVMRSRSRIDKLEQELRVAQNLFKEALTVETRNAIARVLESQGKDTGMLACDGKGLTPLHKILLKDHINTAALEDFVQAGANTRLIIPDGTSVLKLCMSIPTPGTALMVIGRGLNYSTTFMEIMCDRLNNVRGACQDSNDREHMLVYLSAQAGYKDVAFLVSLGCNVQVLDSDGYTALQSAVDDDDIVAIEALVLAGATLDAYTADEAPTPVAADNTANDGDEAVRASSRIEPPRNVTAAASTSLSEPQRSASGENDAFRLAEPSNTNEPRTSTSPYPLLADPLLADSLVAESLFAESHVAESMIAESLPAHSLFEESLATPSSTEPSLPQQRHRPRIRQSPRTTSSVSHEGSSSSGPEARPSPTRGWTRPARRDRQKRVIGGSS